MFSAPQISAYPAITPRWSVVTPGSAVTVPLDELKDFVNRPREDTFWDAEYLSFLKVARAEIERAAQFTLGGTTYRATLPAFFDRIRLNKRPFVSVEQIEYVAADTGEITTVPSTLYHALPVDQDCGMVFLGDGLSWPAAARRHDAVRITVKAGYAVDSTEAGAGFPEMPEEIRHALLMTIAAIETKRGDDPGGNTGANTTVYAMKSSRGGSIIPMEARTLIASHSFKWVTV